MSDVPPTTVPFRRARKAALPVVLWAFGIASTILLIGIWGRAVAVDSTTVADAASVVVDSEVARDRVEGWLSEALTAASTAEAAQIDEVAASIGSRPEFDAAVDILVRDVVAGLFADPGEDSGVRVEAALAPLLPVVEAEFADAGLPVEVSRLEQAIDETGVVDLETGDARSVAAVARDARVVLTWVVVLAGAALVALGSLAIGLSEHRYAMVRTLSVRVVLSALSYALIFRVAAWALDPDRGRSPVLGGGAVVLGSNGHVFLIAAGAAAVTAALGGAIAWRRTRRRRSAGTEHAARSDDDTREFASV